MVFLLLVAYMSAYVWWTWDERGMLVRAQLAFILACAMAWAIDAQDTHWTVRGVAFAVAAYVSRGLWRGGPKDHEGPRSRP